MIRIFKLLFLLVISQVAFAQAPSNYTNINGRYRWIAGMFDSTFHIPKGTNPSLRTGGSTNAGALFYKTGDSSLYIYTGTQWLKQAGTAGFVPYSGATDTLDMGQFGLKTKFVQFDTSTRAVTDRVLQWSNDNGTLAFGMTNGSTITQNVGLQQFARVKNVQGSQINKGQVVYLYGASGDRAAVKLADNRADSTSSKTLGIAIENIPINGEGFVGAFGTMSGLNLSAYTPGDQLYLDSIPGGLTKTKPQAPYHMVFIGVVERANAGNGLLFTNVQNGYELEELHNVKITSPVNNKAVLIYDSINRLWVDTTVAGAGLAVTSVATNTGTGITGGTITTTGTLAIDTLLISTRAWRQKGIDSVASLVTGGYVPNSRTITINGTTQDLSANRTYNVGTVTSVATNTGTGITGGTFTTSGTIAADTLLLSTRAWRQKGIDSVASLINTRVSGTTNYIPKFTSSSAIGNSTMLTDANGNIIVSSGQTWGTSAGGLNLSSVSDDGYVTTYYDNKNLTLGAGVTSKNRIVIEGQAGGNNINFNVFGSERMRITGGGNVGIGNTSAISRLQVTGLSASPNNTIFATTSDFALSSTGSLIRIGHVASTGNTTAIIQNLTTGGTASGNISFPEGSVGIGTTSPNQKLTIADAAYPIIGFNVGSTPQGYIGSLNAGGLAINSQVAQPIIFYTNDTERMRLDASGNLGLGTSSPNAKLTVKSIETAAKGISILGRSDDIGTLRFFNAAGSSEQGGFISTSTYLGFMYNDTERMRLDASGNLGLGVTPSAWGFITPLQIKNSTFAGYTTGTTHITYTASNWYLNGSGTDTYIANGAATLYSQASGQHAWYNAPSGTAGNVISFTQAMTLDASGRLGIGTTSPTGLLHLYGADPAFRIQSSTTGNMQFGQWDGTYNRIQGSGRDFLLINTDATNMLFSTNSSERMRIAASGNVGIGVSNPDSYNSGANKLVVGGTSTSGITIAGDLEGGGNILFADGTTGDQTYRGFIYYNHSSDYLTIGTAATERMRITSGGNVGIGTSSPNFAASGRTVLDVNGSSNSMLCLSVAGTAGSYLYQASGNLNISNEVSGNIISYTGGSERMRITSGGNVGIGTTNPTSKLAMVIANSGTNVSGLDITNNVNASFNVSLRTDITQITAGGTGNMVFANTSERMRITSGGDVLIGTTSTNSAQLRIVSSQTVLEAIGSGIGNTTFVLQNTAATFNNSLFYGYTANTGTGFRLLDLRTNNGANQVFYVDGGGNAYAASYNSSSDYRLKQDLKTFNGLSIIDSINVYDFQWKSDSTRSYGVMAHELKQVLPYAVLGEKDGKNMQGVDYSKIVPILVQAIKELKAEIETLKNK